MNFPTDALPADVLQALSRGRTIDAIKLLRASTGLGLQEAKEAIDAHVAGHPVRLPAGYVPGSLPPTVAEALQAGNKIEAIRRMRELTGLGLKESKDAVDALEAGTPGAGATGSPGAVVGAGAGRLLGWVIAAALGALVVYLLMRRGA